MSQIIVAILLGLFILAGYLLFMFTSSPFYLMYSFYKWRKLEPTSFKNRILLKLCELFTRKEDNIKSEVEEKINVYLNSPLDAFNNFGKDAKYNPVESPSFTGKIWAIDKDGIVTLNRYNHNGYYDGCCKIHYSRVRLIN